MNEVDLGRLAVHIMRGPRQVGKSTDLKLIAERALTAGFQPRQVTYLALDLLEAQPAEELMRTIERAYELAVAAPGATFWCCPRTSARSRAPSSPASRRASD